MAIAARNQSEEQALADLLNQAHDQLRAGKAEEAKRRLKKLVKLRPKWQEALYLQLKAERELGQRSEAVQTARKLYDLAPDNPLYAEQLAVVLAVSSEGRNVLPALEIKRRILADYGLYPNAAEIAANIVTLGLRIADPQRVLEDVEPFFRRYDVQGPERLRLSASLAVAAYLRGQWALAQEYTTLALSLRQFAYDANKQLCPGDYPFLYIYALYIRALLDYLTAHPACFAKHDAALPVLHAIGESHCLSASDLKVNVGGVQSRIDSHLMMGVKAYAYTIRGGEMYQFHLQRMLRELPLHQPVMVMFGEIDCRDGEGIMKQWRQPGYDMPSEVATLVASYVRFVKIAQLKRTAPTYIYGVPAPNVAVRQELTPDHDGDFTDMIRHFNACLRAQAQKQGLGYVDIHSVTLGEDGWAKPGVHIDDVHLAPEIVAEAISKAIVFTSEKD